MLTTTFENNYVFYELKDSFLKITYKAEKYIDYEAARAIVNDRLRIQSYKTLAIVCDVTELTDISSEARDYLATYGSTLIKSVAIVSLSSTLKFMTEYYIAINKPKIQMRVFDNHVEAEQFIKTQVK